jgi:hypothetical protein
MAREEPVHPNSPGRQPVPAANDLAGWKAVDQSLFQRISKQLELTPSLRSARAIKQYFATNDLDHFIGRHKDQGVAAAYAAWAVLDYRPTVRSKTHAEKMLAKGLPEAQAILLRARMQAHPSLYRVAGHDPKAGTVTLEDVLLAGTVTVNDRLMSENIEDGLFLTARVFPAGKYHFLELAGPPLGAGMGIEAVGYLRDCGLEFTADGLRRHAYVLGWLWDFVDQWQNNRPAPHLVNTDGDDLLWHTASFSMADEEQARESLARRQDVDYDEGNNEFVWFTEKGRGTKMLGGPVTLGRIELVGGELVLTVNSAKRFAKARQWLEKLPRVVFQGVKTRPWNEPDKDRPMDERVSKPEPVEMTPELAASLQEMFNRQYMGWLDLPIPVLGGMTPRQACRTPEGRQQVAILIRAIPDPMGPAPAHVPREAMLRELGLAPDAGTAGSGAPRPTALPPDGTISGTGKVGRNDPCPCGSGKKYKKCCGR